MSKYSDRYDEFKDDPVPSNGTQQGNDDRHDESPKDPEFNGTQQGNDDGPRRDLFLAQKSKKDIENDDCEIHAFEDDHEPKTHGSGQTKQDDKKFAELQYTDGLHSTTHSTEAEGRFAEFKHELHSTTHSTEAEGRFAEFKHELHSTTHSTEAEGRFDELR